MQEGAEKNCAIWQCALCGNCCQCGAGFGWNCHIELLKMFFEAPVFVMPADMKVCLPF